MTDDTTLPALLRTNTRLVGEIDRLLAQVERLNDEIESRDDAHDEAIHALRDETDRHTAALVSAVRSYFSWVESPPPRIDPAIYSEVLTRFRSDVETALRDLEG